MNHLFADLFTPYLLKRVHRAAEVEGRKESNAEHTFSTMVLARVLLKRVKKKLDEEKVMRLILYHEFIEIHAGDTFILDKNRQQTQAIREQQAYEQLLNELPKEIIGEFKEAYEEGKALATPEAQFVKAVDHLDGILHNIEHHEIWGRYGFTEANLREQKTRYMAPFPELVELFEELLAYLIKKNMIPAMHHETGTHQMPGQAQRNLPAAPENE